MKKSNKKSIILTSTLLSTTLALSCLLPNQAFSVELGDLTNKSDFLKTGGSLDFSNSSYINVGTNTVSGSIANLKWKKFNVPSTQTVDYRFNATNQTILNRVNGTTRSEILGTIKTSGNAGKLFLINPNGVLFDGGKVILNTSGSESSSFCLTDLYATDESVAAFIKNPENGLALINPTNRTSAGIIIKNGSNFSLVNDLNILSRKNITIGGDARITANKIKLITADGITFTPIADVTDGNIAIDSFNKVKTQINIEKNTSEAPQLQANSIGLISLSNIKNSNNAITMNGYIYANAKSKNEGGYVEFYAVNAIEDAPATTLIDGQITTESTAIINESNKANTTVKITSNKIEMGENALIASIGVEEIHTPTVFDVHTPTEFKIVTPTEFKIVTPTQFEVHTPTIFDVHTPTLVTENINYSLYDTFDELYDLIDNMSVIEAEIALYKLFKFDEGSLLKLQINLRNKNYNAVFKQLKDLGMVAVGQEVVGQKVVGFEWGVTGHFFGHPIYGWVPQYAPIYRTVYAYQEPALINKLISIMDLPTTKQVTKDVVTQETRDVVTYETRDVITYETRDVITYETRDVVTQETRDVVTYEPAYTGTVSFITNAATEDFTPTTGVSFRNNIKAYQLACDTIESLPIDPNPIVEKQAERTYSTDETQRMAGYSNEEIALGNTPIGFNTQSFTPLGASVEMDNEQRARRIDENTIEILNPLYRKSK